MSPESELPAAPARAAVPPACVSPAATRTHGGLDDAELAALGLRPDDVLDFSSSTNPYGPDPRVLRAVQEAAIGRYPDSGARRAREALAASIGAAPEELVLGNGAADLLWSLARCLLAPGERALMVEPTFSELGAAARAVGADVTEWRSRPEQGFAVDLEAVGEHARRSGARLLYLCAPNTPTGTALPAEQVATFAALRPELRIVLDQSFLSLSERHEDAGCPQPPNVIRVRSLTKDHGIPGVRLGYLIAGEALCRRIEASRPAWTTSAFAQAAAIASCESGEFVRQSRERLLADRRALERELAALGLTVLPSSTNFLLARAPGSEALRARLLSRHRVSVRDCASFGLPGFLRFAAKPAAARARLVEALGAELSGGVR